MIGEIGENLQLNQSTAFRLLSTLSQYRLVTRTENTNRYGLGLGCLELSRAYQEGNNLREIALPVLKALRDEVKETVHLAVLDRMEVVYLEKLPGLFAIGLMSSQVGGRSPAYCTGLGKMLLAYLDPQEVRSWYCQHGLPQFTGTTIGEVDSLLNELRQFRLRGYALDHGEHEQEVSCIAVPIFDHAGRVNAAISISGPSTRLEPLEENAVILDKIREAGANVSCRLGYYPSKF